jgi:hypothetical protein
MNKAPSLARKLIDAVMGRYGSRVSTALAALAQAGPLCPAVELVIKVSRKVSVCLHAPGWLCFVMIPANGTPSSQASIVEVISLVRPSGPEISCVNILNTTVVEMMVQLLCT